MICQNCCLLYHKGTSYKWALMKVCLVLGLVCNLGLNGSTVVCFIYSPLENFVWKLLRYFLIPSKFRFIFTLFIKIPSSFQTNLTWPTWYEVVTNSKVCSVCMMNRFSFGIYSKLLSIFQQLQYLLHHNGLPLLSLGILSFLFVIRNVIIINVPLMKQQGQLGTMNELSCQSQWYYFLPTC